MLHVLGPFLSCVKLIVKQCPFQVADFGRRLVLQTHLSAALLASLGEILKKKATNSARGAESASSTSCRLLFSPASSSHHLSGDQRERTSSSGVHCELCGDDEQLCVSLLPLKPTWCSLSAASGPL